MSSKTKTEEPVVEAASAAPALVTPEPDPDQEARDFALAMLLARVGGSVRLSEYTPGKSNMANGIRVVREDDQVYVQIGR